MFTLISFFLFFFFFPLIPFGSDGGVLDFVCHRLQTRSHVRLLINSLSRSSFLSRLSFIPDAEDRALVL